MIKYSDSGPIVDYSDTYDVAPDKYYSQIVTSNENHALLKARAFISGVDACDDIISLDVVLSDITVEEMP